MGMFQAHRAGDLLARAASSVPLTSALRHPRTWSLGGLVLAHGGAGLLARAVSSATVKSASSVTSASPVTSAVRHPRTWSLGTGMVVAHGGAGLIARAASSATSASSVTSASPVTTDLRQPRSWPRRLLAAGIVIPGSAVLTWQLSSEEQRARARALVALPVRLGRDVATAAAMAADYYFSLRGLTPGSPEREAAKEQCHWRCADRLQRLCFANGGIYLKLGQHLAQLDYLVPKEYVLTMRRVMLDRCPTSSYMQVCRVITSELGGRTPEELFVWFDPYPVASASLAQVHQARLRDGSLVAVKVQHEHLSTTALADMATVRMIVSGVHRLFPDFDYRWLIDEVEESLPQELDFRREARNLQRCAANFATSRLKDAVAVPRLHPDYSAKRVMTMEWMDGVGVADVAAIKGMGLRTSDVAKLVSEVFSEMIFKYGFVHCDPHAANLLVRPMHAHTAEHPGLAGFLSRLIPGLRSRFLRPRPQLVLLDHGLYRSLPPDIRHHYAGLWKGLVLGNPDAIKRHSIGLGAGEDLYVFLASTITLRSWDTLVEGRTLEERLVIPDTEEERQQLQKYAADYHKEVGELLRRVPRVVLLLLKTNDCLRSVDKALGAPATTFVITARACARALLDEALQGIDSVARRVSGMEDGLLDDHGTAQSALATATAQDDGSAKSAPTTARLVAAGEDHTEAAIGPVKASSRAVTVGRARGGGVKAWQVQQLLELLEVEWRLLQFQVLSWILAARSAFDRLLFG